MVVLQPLRGTANFGILVALAFLLLPLSGCSAPSEPDAPLERPDRTSVPPPWFVDVASAKGITLTIGHPDRRGAMDSMAGGVAVADVDGDGWMDIYVANDGPNRLYRNNQGTFQDVTMAWGAQDDGVGRVALFFDFDNDGDPDLFLGNIMSPSRLLRNDGGKFMDVSIAAGVTPDVPVHAAAAADIDNDGDLDLYVGNYGTWWLDGPQYTDASQRVQNDMMFRNNGDGTFSEVGAAIGFTTPRWTLGASFVDFDKDGDIDLGVSNDFGGDDSLWSNRGDGTFELVNNGTGFISRRDGMGVIWADFDGNGWPDVYISNIFSKDGMDPVRRGNELFYNHGGLFTESGAKSGTQDAGWSWGGVAFDADSDGDLDLFVPNGFQDAQPTFDPANPGRDMREGIHQKNRFFENLQTHLGEGRFIERGSFWGLDLPVNGRGAAAIDFDRDGDVDLVHAVFGEKVMLLENRAPQGHYIAFHLQGASVNRDAAGAVVEVQTGNRVQTQTVTLGHGYLSQNTPVLHFGLGSHATVDEVRVLWPDGSAHTYKPAVDALYLLRQGARVLDVHP
jgi:enediyne biosynthesis protein E4